ncbi:MAG: alpha/beta fold hydrolase [Gemmatimonadaceae bacterium]
MTRDEFIAYRRSLGRTPALDRMTVRVRGLEFAVWTSPFVTGMPPLLLVNGGLLYDHALLWPALSPLAVARQVILYDQRGRGESQAPPDPIDARIDDDADDVGALRRALGIRQWDVLGHSWGGAIAMLGTLRDLAGVRRLITLNSVGPTSAWMERLHANALAKLDGENLATVIRLVGGALHQPDPAIQAEHARAIYPAWFADASFASYFTPPQAASLTGAAILARLRREGYDWLEQLRTLSVPTLVLHGERDALPVAVATELSTLLPRARLTLIPDAGHMPFWEAPERLFTVVGDFLAAGTTALPRSSR